MRRLKKIVTAMLAAAVLVSGAAVPMEAQAASTLEKVLYGTAAMVFISRYFSDMDDHQQLQFLETCQKETGVYESAEAQTRVADIYDRLVETGAVERNYIVYVSPDEDINAFMSLGGVMCINKGTLDAMDDDELAYIMAHELVHGEKRHSVNGVKKRVGLQTALSIYLGSEQGVGGVILGNIAANYISNAVFTKDQEKEADSLGFQYLVEAGYNPGGAAASMSVLLDKYGDKPRTGLKGVIAPADHPSTKERVEKNGKRLYEYSGNHVKAKDNWIFINGEKTFQPAETKRYTQTERAYLTAGKLAAVYHDGNVQNARYKDGMIQIGNVSIYTVSSRENGMEIEAALNKGIVLDRGEPVKKKSEVEKRKDKLREINEHSKKKKREFSEIFFNNHFLYSYFYGDWFRYAGIYDTSTAKAACVSAASSRGCCVCCINGWKYRRYHCPERRGTENLSCQYDKDFDLYYCAGRGKREVGGGCGHYAAGNWAGRNKYRASQ